MSGTVMHTGPLEDEEVLLTCFVLFCFRGLFSGFSSFFLFSFLQKHPLFWQSRSE